MDYAACNVVYVDCAAQEDRLVKRGDVTFSANFRVEGSNPADDHASSHQASQLVEDNLRTLLEIFSENIPYDDQLHDKLSREVRTPSPSTKDLFDSVLEDQISNTYGIRLLQWITTEIQYQSLSRLIVPVAVVKAAKEDLPSVVSRGRTNSNLEAHLSDNVFSNETKRKGGLATSTDQVRTMRCLDAGAVDVLTSPLLPERVPGLAIHAYKAHKDALKEHRALLEMKRGRKRSWVGVDDKKPYAYLREAMVSGLMDGICKLGGDDDEPIGKISVNISSDRKEYIAAAIGSWHFSAHDLTDDELLHASSLMLEHALAMAELEQWRISTENLTGFLVASRSAYNAFVPYHNFRHVVDVLQACFHFLVQLGRLPSYPTTSNTLQKPPPSSPIAELIRPFDALTLLITAIGHDVGHPGVNNAFLVTLNAPLAQLYNDRSVLESFHCAAYSQILRRHWPAAFQCLEMRQLMISSILATDMGLHFDYMKKLGWLQEKLHANGGTDGWNGRLLDEQKTLACSLLIKCADISNVVRKYDVAAQWTMILTDEFSRQAAMEEDLGIPSALFAPPVREIIELGKSQLGFMNMFAIPLFQGVTDVMPGMAFCVEELQANKLIWEEKIAEEQRARQNSDDSILKDGTFSPRSMSLASPSDGIQKTSNLEPDLRKLLLKSTTNRIFDEGQGKEQHTPLPESISEGAQESLTTTTEASSNRAPKPSQLQLPLATASAPEIQDHADMAVTPSLVTDPVVANPPPPPPPASQEKGRSSDGTEGSGTTDWTSQATSATTGKMPLSPSTQGTSVTSEEECGTTPTGYGRQSNSTTSSPNGKKSTTSEASTDLGIVDKDGGKVKGGTKTLKKKTSRFRMNFWKRREREVTPSPPPPTTVSHSVSVGGESEPTNSSFRS